MGFGSDLGLASGFGSWVVVRFGAGSDFTFDLASDLASGFDSWVAAGFVSVLGSDLRSCVVADSVRGVEDFDSCAASGFDSVRGLGSAFGSDFVSDFVSGFGSDLGSDLASGLVSVRALDSVAGSVRGLLVVRAGR